ncbi:hypothetical protein SLEP1_g36871 [Rubroshorea leprosula]|uniref:Uncharacterized protein n=1 Tax=Rubroshorea leprosula TaxID=152421 RepID=A0AAV5KT63_9ROSI|nr:hypothetical protein SLEP1_g36871 [Rubroshorea leprosula]
MQSCNCHRSGTSRTVLILGLGQIPHCNEGVGEEGKLGGRCYAKIIP